MKVELNFTIGVIVEENYFNRNLKRGIEYKNDKNIANIKKVFDEELKPCDFETNVDYALVPGYERFDAWFRENGNKNHQELSKFIIDELTMLDSSMSKLYEMYLNDNNLEDTNEEKAKYALELMNTCCFEYAGVSLNNNVPLCSFPPHTSNWWVKFEIPDCIEDARYEKRSKGKYDPDDYNVLVTERGPYPIGVAFDKLDAYPREAIEKLYLPNFIVLFFKDCPNREDRRFRDFLNFDVNLD